MALVILAAPNPVVGEASLPDSKAFIQLFFHAVRKTTFDELQGLFQRNVCSGRNEQVKVIRHDHKFMQQKPFLRAIILENIQQ